MTYKLNNGKSSISVSVIGLNEEDENKIINQLYPFIVLCNNKNTHLIKIQKGIDNKYYCDDNILYVTYCNKNFMYKTIRQAIRDIIYFDYLENGYNKLHAAVVKKNLDSTIIIGPDGSGKTSLALGLCNYCNYSLIDGDLVLIKDNNVIGWQTAIGLRKETAKILGFEYDKNNELTWFWPIDLIKKGYSFDFSGNVKDIVVPKFNFEIKVPKFRVIQLEEKKKKLLDNLHYLEMNKKNYWNKKNTDILLLKEKFFENNDIINKRMIEYESNGLSENNIKILNKILGDV